MSDLDANDRGSAVDEFASDCVEARKRIAIQENAKNGENHDAMYFVLIARD